MTALISLPVPEYFFLPACLPSFHRFLVQFVLGVILARRLVKASGDKRLDAGAISSWRKKWNAGRCQSVGQEMCFVLCKSLMSSLTFCAALWQK